jgi:dTDP-4-amino-4,6-dideoxygalactose transaminase
MGGEELQFVNEAFSSNYIAPLGPMVDAFEKEFAEKLLFVSTDFSLGLAGR